MSRYLGRMMNAGIASMVLAIALVGARPAAACAILAPLESDCQGTDDGPKVGKAGGSAGGWARDFRIAGLLSDLQNFAQTSQASRFDRKAGPQGDQKIADRRSSAGRERMHAALALDGLSLSALEDDAHLKLANGAVPPRFDGREKNSRRDEDSRGARVADVQGADDDEAEIAATIVPEPAGLSALGLSVVALLSWRRRRWFASDGYAYRS